MTRVRERDNMRMLEVKGLWDLAERSKTEIGTEGDRK